MSAMMRSSSPPPRLRLNGGGRTTELSRSLPLSLSLSPLLLLSCWFLTLRTAAAGSPSELFDVGQAWGVVFDNINNSTGQLWVSSVCSEIYRYSLDGTLLSSFSRASSTMYEDSGCGITIDLSGNLYIVDASDNAVQKLSPTGAILQKFTSPSVLLPQSIAVDASYNVYVADSANARVVQWYPNGVEAAVVSTSNPTLEPQGVAVDISGSLYITDTANSRVLKRTPSGTVTTFYSNSSLNGLGQVTVDWQGNVYVTCYTESANEQGGVIQISPAGVYMNLWYLNSFFSDVFTYAFGLTLSASGNLYIGVQQYCVDVDFCPSEGTGDGVFKIAGVSSPLPTSPLPRAYPGDFGAPCGVLYDGYGNLWATDSTNNRIVRMTSEGVVQTTLNSISSLSPTTFNEPCGMAMDSSGHLYVADEMNKRLLKLTDSLALVTSYPIAGAPALGYPLGITIDSANNIWYADVIGNRVVQLHPNGTQGVVVTTTNPALDAPTAVAVDASGNLYITDLFNNRVVKRTVGGVISTFFTDVSLPYAVLLDWGGNILISDYGNNHVLQVSTSGALLQTLTAPLLAMNPRGLTIDYAGDLYVADYNSRVVKFFAVTPPIHFRVISVGVHFPWGLVFDGIGNLYVGDLSNGQVVRMSTAGVINTTFTLTPAVSVVQGLAIDQDGDLYVADGTNRGVLKWTAEGVQLAVFTDVVAGIFDVQAVAVDVAFNVYVSDQYYQYVVQFSPNATVQSVLTTAYPTLATPLGLACDGTEALYISDDYNQRVMKRMSNGDFITFYTALTLPGGLVVDWQGNLFIADTNRVVQVSRMGVLMQVLIAPGLTLYPVGLTLDYAGNLYVADSQNGRVVQFLSAALPYYTPLVPYPPLSSPWAVMWDGVSAIYVSDSGHNRIIKMDTNGTPLLLPFTFNPALSFPAGLGIDSSGDIYVCDSNNNRVVKFTSGGVQLQIFTTTNPSLSGPFNVQIDSNQHLWISDTYHNRIVQLYPNGTQASVFTTSNPSLHDPYGLVFDAAGSLFIADAFNSRIVKRYSNGTYITFYTNVFQPGGVTLDGQGNLIISDSGNNRILSVSPTAQLLQVWSTQSLRLAEAVSSTVDSQGSIYVSDAANGRIVKFINVTLPKSQPTALVNGTLCYLQYALPGNVDYPFSTATTLTFQYSPNVLQTTAGPAVSIARGSGMRTFTNRFGVSISTPITYLNNTGGLLYLNSTTPVDDNGLAWSVSSPVQLPGAGPSTLYSVIHLHNTSSGGIVEGSSSFVDGLGFAFLSSVPGFLNITIGASNVNSLAANYGACQAPITFTNGLRPPTQPSASDGGLHVNYSYTISDGSTYLVQTNLSISTASAFATLKDQLGNPYQVVKNCTGRRLYIYLPTGERVVSSITGLNSTTSTTQADQRFYPYSLLSAAPGVYSINTAPLIDANGLQFSVSPSVGANGLPYGTSTLYNAVSIFLSAATGEPLLIESSIATSTNPPLIGMQKQSYSFE